MPNSNTVQRGFATYCQQFKQLLPLDLFTDARDGDIRSMKLVLTYPNGGQTVSKHEWIQLNTEDPNNQYLYGFVTPKVDKDSLANRTYSYEIMCTDSSGRTARKKIEIQIYGSVPDPVTNTITLGITNHLPSTQPDAYVLWKLTDTLATYQDSLDAKARIFVSHFQRNSMIKFSYCQLACSQSNMNELYKRLQTVKYQPNPSTELKSYLRQRGFETSYVFIDSSKCLPASSINIITTNQCPPIQIPLCGSFSSIIPRSCFTDTSGSDTRSFLLDMQTRNGAPLPASSWLQFDIPRQMVYGTVVANDAASSSQTYKLSAKHPSSRRSVSTNLQVNINGYGTYYNVKKEVCQITLEFTTNSDRQFGFDVDVLQDLISTITSFSNSNPDSLIIIQFTRNEQKISLTYSNCSWTENLEKGVPTDIYLQTINQNLEKYFLVTQTTVVGITSSFKDHLASRGYQYRSVLTTYGCTKPPNPPPSRMKDLNLDINQSCGIFESSIPADTFMDRKYGNTRQLFLELFQEDSTTVPDWIGVNSKQDLYGMINKQISEQQPSLGYRFTLKATNPVGQSSITSVTVKLKPKTKWINEYFKIIVGTIPSQRAENRLPYKVALIKKLEEFPMFINIFQGSFYVQELVPGSFGDLIRISYCDQCNGLNYLQARSLQFPKNQNELIQYLSLSGFNIQGSLFVEFPSTEQLKTECKGVPAAISSPLAKEIEFCSSNNIWNLVNDYTSIIENFKVSITRENGSPISSDSWINIVTKPYRIMYFPTESVWRHQPPHGYRYNIVIRDETDSVIIGTPAMFVFKIVGTPNRDGLKYTLSLTSTEAHSTDIPSSNDAAFIYNVWSKMNKYYYGTTDRKSNLQHINLQRNSNLKAEITWMNCSLPTSCKGGDVDTVNSLLKTDTKTINPALISVFKPEYEITNITILCSDNPPIVHPKLNLTIPLCGCFSYKLPDDFATDEHDQSKLIIEMFNSDGMTRIQRPSWIVFKADTNTIEALPDDSTISLYDKKKGFVYILRVTDTKGKYSTSEVTVHLDLKSQTQQSFLSYSFSFQSLFPNTLSFVDLKKTFLESFVQVSNTPGEAVDRFRVASLSVLNQRTQQLVIQISNCSVSQYTCPDEYQKILDLSNDLVGTDLNRLKQSISSLTTGKIIIKNVLKSFNTRVNRPPLLANPVRVINVTYCDNGAFKIPGNTFRNEGKDTVKYIIYERSGKPIPKVNWINIVDDVLYVSPLTSTPVGLYTFRLEATDQCNLKTQTDLKVVLTGDNKPSPYYLVMQFKYKSIQQNYANSIWNIRKAIERCSKNTKDPSASSMVVRGLRTERFSFDDSGYMKFQYSTCSVNRNQCLQTDLDKLTANIFSSPNIVAESFKQCFRPECELLQATEFRVDECKPKTDPPKVVLQPIFNATFCQKAIFKIDPRTFTDEKGEKDARSMNLELLTENFDPLPRTEWIQFNTFQQEIYGYPRTSEAATKTLYKYKLRATEIKTGASSSTDVVININGKPNVNYVMVLKGKRAVTLQSNIDEEIQIMDSLQQVLGASPLNDVSFERKNGENLEFKWSFCTTTIDQCDCQKITRFTRSKDKLKTKLGSLMVVDSITEQKRGPCSEGPILLNPIPELQTIPVGNCYSFTLPRNLYYDRQDGNNVQHFIQNQDGTAVSKDHWLQINQSGSRLCGLLPYMSYVSSVTSNNYQFKLGSEDSCLNQVANKTEVKINPDSYVFPDFLLIGVYDGSKEELMSNCSKIDLLMNKIADYNNVNKTEINVKEIRAVTNSTGGPANLTEIIWGYRVVNCSNNTYTELYESYFVKNEDQKMSTTTSPEMKQEFIDHMKPDFQLKSLRHSRAGDCAILAPPPAQRGDDNFPLWWLWLLLAIALIALLLWLLWICCPRACPNCCSNLFGMSCCTKCCTPSGNYSSFKGGGLPSVVDDEEAIEPVEIMEQGMIYLINYTK